MTGEPVTQGGYTRWPPGDGSGRGGRFAPKNGAPARDGRRRGSGADTARPGRRRGKTAPAGEAKGIDPATLWSGPAARARKYASDELKQWWSEHGGRVTAGEFAAQFTGDRAGAEKARMSGQGRDYGI